ncbi:U1 small nuclear ribonucleoprotein C-like [Prionailurus iriomotensis]
MPKFYCDYCDTYLTHDSPSVRKTHCSGRKHKENVKDYYQKWMEEQAQSLIDKTKLLHFSKERFPPTPFSAPPPAGAMIPPPPSLHGSSSPWYDASTPYGGPSHDANDGPSSSWDDASGTWFSAWASCSPFLQLRTNAYSWNEAA